jgi:hypothetical protein
VVEWSPPVQEPASPEPDRVRAQLARLLSSDTLSNAPSLRRFLSYVVERSLAGDNESVKEYAIGLEVFGRGEAFDPRIDTIVRVQARRLRSKLDEYYEVEGALDGVVIDLPKGCYVPAFRTVVVSDLGDGPGDGLECVPSRHGGRERELDKLRGLIGRDARLAILTSGGCTVRLALQLALDDFANDDRGWALRMARSFLAYWDWSESRERREGLEPAL